MSDSTTVDPELLRQAESLAGEPAQAAAPANAAPAGQPDAPADYMGDARELVEFVYEGVRPAYPGIEPIYTPNVRARLADRLGRVMEKHKLSLAAIFAKWAPEIGLVMVTLPLVPPTVEVIREQRAKDRAARELARSRAQQPANPNAPAST